MLTKNPVDKAQHTRCLQVLISPQSQVKDMASPPAEVSTMMTGAKMKEALVWALEHFMPWSGRDSLNGRSREVKTNSHTQL